MFRPLAAFLHRSGLLSYLRDQWRAEDASLKQALKSYATREVNDTATSLRADLRALRDEHQAQLDEQASRADVQLRELAHEVKRLSSVLAFNAEHRERQHAAAFDPPRIRAHVAAAVDRSPLDLDPAAHLVVDNLLPADVYAAVLAGIPPERCFSHRDMTKQNFRLSTTSDVAPEFTVQAWHFLEREIIDNALLPALLDKFRPHIEAAYAERHGAGREQRREQHREQRREQQGSAMAARPHRATAGRLMLRRPGYHLDPHLDPSRAIVTCLLYLAKPGDETRFGTQFFRINRAPDIDRTNTYFPEAHGYSCELARSVEFLPNRAVAFLNHNVAHGAGIPADAPKETRRYAYQFYVSAESKDEDDY